MQHFIRVGVLGQVGRFVAPDAGVYPRGARVICRTRRGLELGEVLAASDELSASHDGQVLRRVSVTDDLLLDRLARHRDEAFAACSQLLRERRIEALLVDVEHLFDGESVYFYFLGETTPELESLTAELAQRYDARVQFQQFAEAVTHGCGPDCGSEAAGGCGTCGSCAVAGLCKK